MDYEKITQLLRKAIVERDARTPAEREKIYASARAVIQRSAEIDPTAMARLEASIATVESSFTVEPKVVASSSPARRMITNLPAFIIAFALGGLITGVFMSTVIPALVGGGKTSFKLDSQYRATAAYIPAATTFLNRIAEAIFAMQKADRSGLEAKASKGFVSLQALAPQLAKEISASLPKGTSVVVRANGDNFKILFDSTLCAAVKIEKPEMVDPVRDARGLLGCPRFGIWTAGAAKW